MKTLRVLVLLLFTVSPAAAQMHQHDDHSHAGERLGKVDFPISCSEGVQETFNRAVATLHSFWYDEAEKTFREVAAADPDCGMAWWGVAMSNYHPIWAAPNPAELERGVEAAARARKLGAETERERGYIEAVATFYQDADRVDHQARARAFESAMEKLSARFPDDDEAAIFHALTLIAHGMALPTDKTYAHQKKAAEILNGILPRRQDHPGIAHYIIHSFDYPALAHLAVPAARAYAKIAPSSAHALHMPSHIFIRLGLWQEAIDSNLASAKAGRDHVARTKPGATSFDALHAYDYLVYGYLQRGEDERVGALVDEVQAVRSLDVDNFAAYYALAAIPSRNALERHKWAEAAELTLRPAALPWDRYPYAEALISFARAMGAARSGDPEGARQEVARLGELRQKLLDQKNAYWADQVEIQHLAAEGWIAWAENRNQEAAALLRSAAEKEDATEKHPVTPGAVLPAREMLGDLLLALDQPVEALAEYERALQDTPNRLNALSGAARAAQLAGDRGKAREYHLRVANLLAGTGGSPAVMN